MLEESVISEYILPNDIQIIHKHRSVLENGEAHNR